MADDADLETLISNQRLELMAASRSQSDLDLAFDLQMQEAMAASLSLQPSSSSNPNPNPNPIPIPIPIPNLIPNPNSPNDDLQTLLSFQTIEFDRFLQEKEDSSLSKLEMARASTDLRLKFHDERIAREIDAMPEEDWEEYGDNYERPIETAGKEEERPFRVYFKGMTSREAVRGQWALLAAVAVAVCDPEDRLVLKIQKPLFGDWTSRGTVEAKALLEALVAVGTLGVKKVDLFFDYRTLHNHVTGKWIPKQRKVVNLMEQISLQLRKLEEYRMFLVPRCSIKYVFKLARDAIDYQITQTVELNGKKEMKETCNICLEDTDSPHMLAVDICLHRFCVSCLRQHVEVKLLQGMLPSCPHDGCKNMLTVESCRKFLSPKLLDIMLLRVKEASIPVTEKIYCPYPKCSALMSSREAIRPPQESSSKQPAYDTSGLRKCVKCSLLFCIKCKVPWHDRLSCYDYKRLNPRNQAEDSKLKVLAREKLWRQCVKCSHMIELAEGCFHMTCRCGYEFCYTCGAEWKDKKATCACPLWNEGNILYDVTEDEELDYFDDDDYDDDDYDENYYDGYFHHGEDFF